MVCLRGWLCVCWTALTQLVVRAARRPGSAGTVRTHRGIKGFPRVSTMSPASEKTVPAPRRLERTKQFAVRAVRLPDSADTEHIQGKYENGVLTLKARPWRAVGPLNAAGRGLYTAGPLEHKLRSCCAA